MIRKIDSNKFSLTILKVTTFSRIRQSFFSSMDENLVKNRDIFGYTRKNAIFAQKIKYERKYRISKEV